MLEHIIIGCYEFEDLATPIGLVYGSCGLSASQSCKYIIQGRPVIPVSS